MLDWIWCISLTTLRFHDLFLGRNVGGSAGEMQMFENLAAEAYKRIASVITWSREVDINLAIATVPKLVKR